MHFPQQMFEEGLKIYLDLQAIGLVDSVSPHDQALCVDQLLILQSGGDQRKHNATVWLPKLTHAS